MKQSDMAELDRVVLAVMAAIIFAGRRESMAASITMALKLAEQVRLDFPLPGDAPP